MALSGIRSKLIKNPALLSQTIRLSSTAANSKEVIPTWSDYFKLRKKRRYYEVGSYLPSTLVPAAGTLSYFLQMEIDPLTKILGMDPLMAVGVSTMAAGFAGFLLGPMVGNTFFKIMNSKYSAEMDLRDKDFYEHVKRNRVEARLNSISNPVPDYYGEKIQSIHDYRSWLRKQREHYRKVSFGGKLE